jgi:hypothetical protein
MLKSFLRKISLQSLRWIKPYQVHFRLPKGEINFNQLISIVYVLYLKEYKLLKRQPPLTTLALPVKFKNQLEEHPPRTFVIETSGWTVWGNQGAVITNEGYLFKDVSREFGNQRHSIFDQFKIVPVKELQGLTTVLSASGSDVYYHWMFDILPRISLLKKCGKFNDIEHFIINYTGRLFQKQTLKRAGVNLSKIIVSSDHWNFNVKVSELIIPSLPSNNDSPSYEACLYLRDLYKKELTEPGGTKKIYIKRSSGRHIVNEEEFLEILKPLGFEVLCCEQLTVAEQAAVFSKAEIVVGAHGAGFTNLVFCNAGTRIIDIFSPTWINPCYWILSNHINLKYACLIGKTLGGKTITDDKASNILVDIPEFQKILHCLYA